eukprot:5102373-Amphidinium_carterae.2
MVMVQRSYERLPPLAATLAVDGVSGLGRERGCRVHEWHIVGGSQDAAAVVNAPSETMATRNLWLVKESGTYNHQRTGSDSL